MSEQGSSAVRINFFKYSHGSFVAALDGANIPHERLQLFSSAPQASGIVECISALSDAMPWNSLAKVITAWIDARKSREVIIQLGDGQVVHAKGYSASEVEKFLPLSVNVTVIDTKADDET